LGRLTGKHKATLDDVQDYQKNLESIGQRETVQPQILEDQVKAEQVQNPAS